MACGEIQQQLVEGVDYDLDLSIGRIKFLSTGALGPVIQQFYDGGGCAVRIDYDCPGAPHILCPSKIDTCLPCNDDPVLNISAEDSDTDRFLFNFNTRQRPRLGFRYENFGCKRWCFSEVSQSEADLCAILQALECINDGWRDETGPTIGTVPPFQVPQRPPFFFNFAQTCTTFCPDGSSFGFTLSAGQVGDRNQAQADRIAFSFACRISALRRICIRTSSLPMACRDSFYSKQLLAAGGTPFRVTFENFGALSALCAPAMSFPNSVFPYVWSATGLPAGLSLEPCSGMITGTPTESGFFNVTVRAQDSIGSFQTKTLTLKVIEFTTAATLPEATVDIPYSHSISVSPSGTYTFAFSSENVPDWLHINSATGQLFGTPDVVQDNIVFTVIVTDASGGQCEESFSLNVDEQSTLLDDLLFSTPLDTYGSNYPVAFTAFPGGQLNTANSTVVAKIVNGFNSGPTAVINDNTADTLGFPGGAFTYAFWLKINSISVTGDILDRPGTNKGYIFRLTPAGALTFFHGNGAGFDSVVAGIALGTGVWYHVVATYASGVAMTIRVSTEGAFNAKATSVPTGFARADDFTATTLRLHTAGTMDIIYDEIDCWTRVISDAEAQEHWNNGNGIAYPF